MSPNSQLARTTHNGPVLVAVGPQSDANRCDRLRELGCEIVTCAGDDHVARLASLLNELSTRGVTNLLVEGGSRLLGNLLQMDQIDEVHAFIAPKLLGGTAALSPIAGLGFSKIDQALILDEPKVQTIDEDIYVCGTVQRSIDTETSLA